MLLQTMKIGDFIKFTYERTNTLQPTGEVHIEYGIVVEVTGEMASYIVTSCHETQGDWLHQSMLGKRVTNYTKDLVIVSESR